VSTEELGAGEGGMQDTGPRYLRYIFQKKKKKKISKGPDSYIIPLKSAEFLEISYFL